MARRENQSLVIALIVMVMLVVTLCISTYVFWNKAQKSEKELTSAKDNARNAQTSMRKGADEVLAMKKVLGYEDEDADAAAMQVNFEEDMKIYGNGIASADQNYRKLPEHLLAAIESRNEQVAQLTAQLNKALQDKDAADDQGNKRVGEAAKGQKEAGDDLKGEREKYTASLQELGKQVNGIKASTNRAVQEEAAKRKDAESQLTQLQNDYDKMRAKNTQLEEKLRKLQNVSFERPDGKITYVNQRSRTVYVNLGRQDGLQRQATFSVYDANETDMTRLEPKGKIEITKILGDHLAEGRILDDSPSNPVLTSDAIYSPVWEAGRPIHFALAGLLDTNGDGKSDAPMVKNLISRNGGVIDAEVNDRGEGTGKVGIQTRYLIVGKRPTDKSDTAGQKEYRAIRNEAEISGVSEISLERFLTDMGYQPVGNMIKLGRGGTMPDPTKGQPRPGTGRFRPRQPPKAKSLN